MTRDSVRYLAIAVIGGLLVVGSAGAGAAPPTPASNEAELLAVLRSDAPEADKALTCKLDRKSVV